jgi:hypothetical protein
VQRLAVEVEPADDGMPQALVSRAADLDVLLGPQVAELGAGGQEPADQAADAAVAGIPGAGPRW